MAQWNLNFRAWRYWHRIVLWCIVLCWYQTACITSVYWYRIAHFSLSTCNYNHGTLVIGDICHVQIWAYATGGSLATFKKICWFITLSDHRTKLFETWIINPGNTKGVNLTPSVFSIVFRNPRKKLGNPRGFILWSFDGRMNVCWSTLPKVMGKYKKSYPRFS